MQANDKTRESCQRTIPVPIQQPNTMEIVKRLSKKQLFQHSYKDPSEYFASLLVLPNRIAGVAGLNVLSPDFKRFTPNLIGLVLTYVMFAGVSIVRWGAWRRRWFDLLPGDAWNGNARADEDFHLEKLVWIQEYSKRLFREEGIAHKCLIMNNILLMNVVTKLILVFYAFTTVFMLIATQITSFWRSDFGIRSSIVFRGLSTGVIWWCMWSCPFSSVPKKWAQTQFT